jgi:hypothetical protein
LQTTEADQYKPQMVETQPNNSFTHTNLYPMGFKQRATLQRIEIYEHKWYLCERLGHTMDLEEAAMDFVDRGYAEKFDIATKMYVEDIIQLCQETCQGKCKGGDNCPINFNKNILHKVLREPLV